MKDKKDILTNIKSNFIFRKIFSLLANNKKLDIINYNKNIQKKLNITLEDYKKYGKKYKEGDRNGLGYEYLKETKRLVFAGNYKNNKRNGKGKEFFDNEEILDGYYINGILKEGKLFDKYGNIIKILEKNGKLKEFYDNGKIRFDGEMLNDKKWNGIGYNYNGNKAFEIKEGKGFVMEYDYYYGNKIFEGEYINGVRNGKGKEYYENGKLLFEGEYLYGKRDGNGKEFLLNGEVLNGYYKQDKLIEGKKIDKDGNDIMILEKNGKLKEFFDNGKIRFNGEILDGKKWNGIGYDYNGKKAFEIKEGKGFVMEYDYYYGAKYFEGEYINGVRNGKGKELYESGDILFEGEYLNGKRNGKGKEYYLWFIKYESKLKFEGEYLNGKKHGEGKEYHRNGYLEFEGEYLNGERNGEGTEYYNDGSLSYKGEYLNGKKHGFGKEYYGGNSFADEYSEPRDYLDPRDIDRKQEQLMYEGEYLNDEKNGKGKEYNMNGQLIYEGPYLNGKKLIK